MKAKFFKTFFLSSLFLGLGLFFTNCSTGKGSDGAYRIALDTNWYPLNFQEKNAYVLGFTDDLLFEISRISGLQFEKITTNWDMLLPGLQKEKYDAVLSSLPPYNFNKAQYDFSEGFLSVGPVLVTNPQAKFASLAEMKQKIIGILSGSRDIMLVQRYPDVLIRMFDSNPEMLAELERNGVDGAIIEVIPAVGYLNDVFYQKLKMATPPLNDQALRLVTVTGKNTTLQRSFNKALAKLKKNKTYQKLLVKWNLTLEK